MIYGVSGIAIVDRKFWSGINDTELPKQVTTDLLLFDYIEKYNLTAFIWFFATQGRPPLGGGWFSCSRTATHTYTDEWGLPHTFRHVLSTPMRNDTLIYVFVNGSFVEKYVFSREIMCDTLEGRIIPANNITIIGTGDKIYIVEDRYLNDTYYESYVYYRMDNIWGDEMSLIFLVKIVRITII